jgi:hypothetical protein
LSPGPARQGRSGGEKPMRLLIIAVVVVAMLAGELLPLFADML